MTHRVPDSCCPDCGAACKATTCPDDATARPEPGSFSLCLLCGALCIFDAAMQLRTPTLEQLSVLTVDDLFKVSLYKRAVAAMNAENAELTAAAQGQERPA